jgi:hypothetical protein
MAGPPRARELTARWQQKVRARTGDLAALAPVLSWIRTIALEDDVVYLDTLRGTPALIAGFAGGRLGWRGYVRFALPSLPSARPEPGHRSGCDAPASAPAMPVGASDALPATGMSRDGARS